MKNIVSIWFGNFKSEVSFENYIEEKYDNNGDVKCAFWDDFDIDFIDNQFQEAVFIKENITLDKLEDASYSSSFIHKLNEINLDEINSVILVYDFKYDGIIKLTPLFEVYPMNKSKGMSPKPRSF